MIQDRTLPLGNQPIYYINEPSLPGTNCLTLAEVMDKASRDYESDAYIHVFEDGPEGTRIIKRGRVSAIVAEYQFEQDYMDMAAKALGNK